MKDCLCDARDPIGRSPPWRSLDRESMDRFRIKSFSADGAPVCAPRIRQSHGAPLVAIMLGRQSSSQAFGRRDGSSSLSCEVVESAPKPSFGKRSVMTRTAFPKRKSSRRRWATRLTAQNLRR
jgi:hypothetical protein